jgi:hypothetical protein
MRLCAFVERKAISRQYHSYFDWKVRNANAFFALFGDDFKVVISKKLAGAPALREGMEAFMELGATRNNLVHLNFVTYPIEKTEVEIYDLYRKAVEFVKFVEQELR